MHSTTRSIAAVVAIALAAVQGCGGDDDDADAQPQTFEFDFQSGMDGWQPLFTDYPAGTSPEEQAAIDAFFELNSRATKLPAPLDRNNGAVELTGINHHGANLSMLLKRRLTGLRPNTWYRLEFTLTIASDNPRGCTYIVVSTGEGTAINAGAATTEPTRTIVDGQFRHAVNLVNLGDFTNLRECGEGQVYDLKTLSSIGSAAFAETNRDGSVWVVVGTRTIALGLMRPYFDHVTVAVQPDPPVLFPAGEDSASH